jgi:hypothetical protein
MIEKKTDIEQGTHHKRQPNPQPAAIGSITGSVAPPIHRRNRGYLGF